MNSYIIAYDLCSPGQKYEELIRYLKSFSYHFHALESVWVIKTEKNAVALRNAIRDGYLDKNDKLIVVKSGREGAWYGYNDEINSWLSANL